jgi:hypothetical protein
VADSFENDSETSTSVKTRKVFDQLSGDQALAKDCGTEFNALAQTKRTQYAVREFKKNLGLANQE